VFEGFYRLDTDLDVTPDRRRSKSVKKRLRVISRAQHIRGIDEYRRRYGI